MRIEAGSKVDEPAEGVTVLYQVVTKGPTIEARLVDVTAANFTDFTGLNGTLFAGRNLTVLARAESALGWATGPPPALFESGANCATDPTPPPPPPPIPWRTGARRSSCCSGSRSAPSAAATTATRSSR